MPTSRRDLLLAAGAALALGQAHAQPAPPRGATGLTSPKADAPPAPRPPADLIRKKIPATGELLVPIGVGTARRFQGAATEAQLAPLQGALRAFHEGGGSVIDTAPSYGDAEAVVGALVEQLALRNDLFLATKVGAQGREAGMKQIEQSFRNLRTDRIDLIAVHNLQDVGTQLPLLRELKSRGRIRYVGVTTSSESQHAQLAELIRKERIDFVQVDYAIDNRAAAQTVLPAAQERGTAVMINLPFGRGRVFKEVQGKKLPDWAREIGCESWAQFFLKYLIAHDAVTCVVPGTATPRYAEDNIAAARGRVPDAAMRKRMEALIDAV